MPLLGRADGKLVEHLPPMRRILPHLMKTRNESVVYFEQIIDVSNTLAYVERAGEQGPSLFQVMLCAAVRTLALRPRLNQFVVGRRVYRRNAIELSFVVKKGFSDDAAMTMVKVTFEPDDTLQSAARRVDEAIGVGRGDQPTASEREMGLVSRLPRFMIRFLVWGQRVLDYFNLLPASLIRPDPLYASAVLANLGSLGIDSAYHHLYEHGTASLFAVIGRVHKAPLVDEQGKVAVRDVVSVKFSLDERVADGFYCARALDLFRAFVEDPTPLERAPQ